jgi:choline transporter-like protein 2/4/5
VNLMFILTTVMLAQRAGLIGDSAVGSTLDTSAALPPGVVDPSEEDQMYFEIATYVSAVLTGLVLLFTLVMIRRVAIAIACLKVASQAIDSMPLILFFPLIPFALEVLLVAYWMMVAATLYSMGDLKAVEDGGYSLEYTQDMRYMMLYHLFGLLWTNQFLVGYGLCVIAGAVASYYWNRGDRTKMGADPVGAAMTRTARYHLGSIALGSFLVAVIQFVRVILEYIDRKTKEMQEGNPVLKYLMCCVKYCMWYLESVMKFINRNAYIIVAVKGSAYCSAAMRAISLIISNALRLAAVNLIGDTLTWLGKVSVALAAGFLCFLMTDTDMYTNPNSQFYLSSPLLPILLSTMIAYFIATCFFMVYDMAVDTILLSFCEDCMQNDENPKFAPPLLAEAIGMKPGLPGSKNTVAPDS